MADLVGTPVIEARGLRREFGDVVGVDRVDLAVLRGEVFGLVGPDGAGKTTTMRMLCGALRPTSGSAHVAGHHVLERPDEVKRRLGYVPQRFGLYPELTVDENLLFQARIHSVVGKVFEQRLEQLLSFSRLGRFRRHQAHALSGGMKQKLALACALLHEPEILLMDEPTTGVDPVSRGEFWELVLGLASEGMTIMTATTYMDEAERCRRLGLLHNGRLLMCGTPREMRREARLVLLQVTCDRLPTARQAAEGALGVRWVEIFGDRLHVAVERPDTEAAVRQAIEGAGIRVTAVRRIDPGLEDAFFELVRRSRGGFG
jgi:ABC-2 type transport system ATP-binding protein